jgi:uncharacterized protein
MNKAQEYEVIGRPLTDVEIAVGGEREIAQNVRTIITTWRGSVFTDRMFGIDPAIIDQPENMVLALLVIDVTEQVEKYEPRVDIVSINFDRSNLGNGEIIPVVRFRIKEGTLL